MVGIMATQNQSHFSGTSTGQMDPDYDSEEEFIDDTQFEDPEDFVEDISDEELLPDVLDQCPNESDSLDTVIIVDNVPVVGPDRLDKLKTIIRKVFSKFGNVVNEYYPDENGKTKGYIFLEFSNASDASNAIKTANGYKLDKSHTFVVNSFSDFDKYKNVSPEWNPPAREEYKEVCNLKSWLLEPDANDQYSIIYAQGDKVVILQNNSAAPTMKNQRDNWTETTTKWSPKGSYLATFHRQGIALWGGPEFERIQRYNHSNVQLMDFSPCERYIVSYAPVQDANTQEPSGIIIWDAKTGAKKRGFIATGGHWPVFKWSNDGKFVARSGNEVLSVYESPVFGLLDKKSIKMPGMKDFTWSPTQNIIAYWVPEDDNAPARVCLMELPSRREIRVKNLFNVHDCKMHWQKNGDFLCVKVERHTKSKKGFYYNLELFRMREKNIPIDTLEIKDTIQAFEWEPNGNKFCVIHGENPRICASFYELEETTLGHANLLKTFEKKTCNTISWCPAGQFCVLAGLRSMNGVFEFIDTADMTTMNTGEHYMATDVEWDPTGRYLMTGVSWWAHKVDNGYFIWSFQGKILQRHPLDQFCNFSWRPRPESLLSEKELSKIKKELKKYQKQFEQKDKLSQSKASKELIDKRRTLFNEFEDFRARHRSTFEEYKTDRLALREGMITEDDEEDQLEEKIEFFIREEIEVIAKKKSKE